MVLFLFGIGLPFSISLAHPSSLTSAHLHLSVPGLSAYTTTTTIPTTTNITTAIPTTTTNTTLTTTTNNITTLTITTTTTTTLPDTAILFWNIGPPGAPVDLVVNHITDTSVQLSWGSGPDNHSPVTSYTLQARTPYSIGWQTAQTGD